MVAELTRLNVIVLKHEIESGLVTYRRRWLSSHDQLNTSLRASHFLLRSESLILNTTQTQH
jgi:hypothetical protein